KLNLHGSSTGHGVLGIDVQTNKFVLSRLLHIKNLDEQLLLKAIGSFFSTVSQLREKLAQFLQAQVSDAPLEGPLAVPPNLNFII
ncbi:MAG: type III secretion system chaperone, partial [Puniceicoccales bacterium]|nr:type III secretion system chaperone [Puniceicoccales bacterium]